MWTWTEGDSSKIFSNDMVWTSTNLWTSTQKSCGIYEKVRISRAVRDPRQQGEPDDELRGSDAHQRVHDLMPKAHHRG